MAVRKTVNFVDYFGVLKRSFFLYRDNFAVFIVISLIASAGSIAGSFISEDAVAAYPALAAPAFLIFLGSLFLSAWGAAAMIVASGSLAAGRKITVGESLAGGMERLLYYTAFLIVVFCLAAVGFIFFIIPGVYLSVIFVFVLIIAVLEPREPNPLAASKKLVSGNFWGIFFFYIFIGLALLMILLPIMFSAGITGIFMPFAGGLFAELVMAAEKPALIIVTVALYREMKKVKRGRKAPAGGDTAVKLVLGCVSGCLLVVLLMAGAAGLAVFAGKKFFGTEEGKAKLIKVFSPVMKKAGDEVVFPGGVKMQLPDNGAARRKPGAGGAYDVFLLEPGGILAFEVKKTKGADSGGIKSRSEAESAPAEIVKKEVRKSGGGFLLKKSGSGKINGKTWFKYIFVGTKKHGEDTGTFYKEIYFTLHGGNGYMIKCNYPVFDTGPSGNVITAYKEKAERYSSAAADLAGRMVFEGKK